MWPDVRDDPQVAKWWSESWKAGGAVFQLLAAFVTHELKKQTENYGSEEAVVTICLCEDPWPHHIHSRECGLVSGCDRLVCARFSGGDQGLSAAPSQNLQKHSREGGD